MLTFVMRRLLTLPLVMLAVTALIVFLMQFLSPAQRASSFVRGEQQLQNIDAIVKQYGLDQLVSNPTSTSRPSSTSCWCCSSS